VEVTQGVGLRSIMTFMVGFGPVAVFVASFINIQAVWKIYIARAARDVFGLSAAADAAFGSCHSRSSTSGGVWGCQHES